MLYMDSASLFYSDCLIASVGGAVFRLFNACGGGKEDEGL